MGIKVTATNSLRLMEVLNDLRWLAYIMEDEDLGEDIAKAVAEVEEILLLDQSNI